MAPQSSDSRRELVDKPAEVLSDSTDLDVLLAAILDDDAASAPVKPWPRLATEARSEPAPVIAPRVAPAPIKHFSHDIVPVPVEAPGPDSEKDAFMGFLSESGSQNFEHVDQAAPVAAAPSAVRQPTPSREASEALPILTSRQLMLITGCVAVLLLLGAAYLVAGRDDSGVTPSATAPSPAATTPAAAPAPTVTAPAAEVPPTTPTPRSAEAAAPPSREASAKPRVIAKPSPPPASNRTNPVRAETAPAAVVPPPAAPPAAAPAVSQPVPNDAAPAAPPTRVSTPEVEAPRPESSPAAPEAVAPSATAGGAEPAAATTPAAPPAPRGVAPATPARLLTGGAPDYPPALRTARVGGIVEVRFTIDAAGRVSNVRSISGPPQLRAISEAAVRRWRYEPARRGTATIETETSVNFNFDPSSPRRPEE